MITILIYLLGIAIIPMILLTLFECRGYWRMSEPVAMWAAWSVIVGIISWRGWI